MNELIEDENFQEKIGIDIDAFNEKARQIYKKNDEITASIDEIERTLKRGEENRGLRVEVNRILLTSLFSGSEGISVAKGTFTVTDLEKVKINPEFEKLVTFDTEKIKDAKDLAQRANDLVNDPRLAEKLGISLRRFASTAKRVFKEDKDFVARVKKVEESIPELEQTTGRYQTVNRYILQIIYYQDVCGH